MRQENVFKYLSTFLEQMDLFVHIFLQRQEKLIQLEF